VLKNETVVEAPEDVDGVLELCHVLIKDQSDSSGGAGGAVGGIVHATQVHMKDTRRQGPYVAEREEMAEEQGWVARMVHLFRAESLDVQFEVDIITIYELCALMK
jgi:vacuolar protein sorting-associated protein 35